jgi:hypothetical protein
MGGVAATADAFRRGLGAARGGAGGARGGSRVSPGFSAASAPTSSVATARQMVLALSVAHPDFGLSAVQLSRLLALPREDALEALSELLAFDLVTAVDPWQDELEARVIAYVLSARGMATAEELAAVARRALRGWPPVRRPGRSDG